MDLFKISEGKYTIKDSDEIGEGAYSKIYDVKKNIFNNKTAGSSNDKKNKNKKITNDTKKYIVKIHEIKDKREAVNEIEILYKLKKNKNIFKTNLQNIFSNTENKNMKSKYINDFKYLKSKLIKIKDYYIDQEHIYIILKKYDVTLEDFNIMYNKEFNETLPISLIKKIANSLFIGLYELNVSKIIHCDIKPNNILISIDNNKTLTQIIKDINNNKIKKVDLHKFIDIRIIDFNKSQKNKAICKSTCIQTLYYMAPEIILGNHNFNPTIDVWSIGTIIYELLTSHYLFDVFNLNIKYKKNFQNHVSKSDDSSESSSSSHDNYYSSYSGNDMHNLALLYIYKTLLGTNNMVDGKYIESYYSNDHLLGSHIKISNSDFALLENKIFDNVQVTNDKDFYLKMINIFKKIFIYDYSDRLTSEDFLLTFAF